GRVRSRPPGERAPGRAGLAGARPRPPRHHRGPVRHRGRRGPEGAALQLDAPEHGLAYDLTWTGFVPAFQEPTHLDHDANGRAFLHACRLAQLGSWSGWLEVDGNRYEVTPDRWWGSRDRSWGIRPVGDPEPPGNLAGKPAPGFR